ncbi:EboA domain-containing protein [Streptomyces sp. NPDC090026]|uniref:EboA domain-containing protein n=1 Tax=Streptomyces sp. NPDC090026 TaxID=3365923 RepID=UPI0037FF0973
MTGPGPEQVSARLGATARSWFHRALAEASPATGTGPGPGTPGPTPAWQHRFASAGRACGAEFALDVRLALLVRARPSPATLARLYRHGARGERQAVLTALPLLAPPPDTGLLLVEDALRTNDTDLLAAALGEYAAAHLAPHLWRHAVLKCLFHETPVTVVAGLRRRARGDSELGRMLSAYAEERVAAGRPLPPDLTFVLALTLLPKE